MTGDSLRLEADEGDDAVNGEDGRHDARQEKSELREVANLVNHE